MRTIIISEPGKVAVTENEMPKVKEGEALLKLLYGGICGSDLGTYRGTSHMQATREYRDTSFLHRL